MRINKTRHISLACCFLTWLLCLWGQWSYGTNSTALRHPAPVPNFQISHFCLGDTAYFTNTTLLGNTYIWTIFEQGGKNNTVSTQIYTSTTFNIKYLFTHTGTYKIELTANNGHIITIDRFIVIDSVTTANFTYMLCGSRFMNLSVCYDSCFWNFGDGHTSIEESPVHFYDTLGTYRVTLIARKGTMSDTISDSVQVVSNNNLNGNFTSKVYKDSVMFHASDSVSGPFTQYHWSFGDGAVADLYVLSGGRKVYHRYARKDTTYTVFLLVKTTCLSAFSLGTVFVPDSTPVHGTTIFPNPLADNVLHVITDRKAELADVSVLNYLSQPVGGFGVLETTRGFNIDLPGLAQGLYFVRMRFGNDLVTRKFIKE